MKGRFLPSLHTSALLFSGLVQGVFFWLPENAQAQQATTPPARPAGQDGVVELLLKQTRYWLGRSQYDRAAETLAQARQIAPQNPDVLEIDGEWAARKGDVEASGKILKALQKVNPEAAQKLESVMRGSLVSGPLLEEARTLARAGKTTDAVRIYERLFPNGPPEGYALEYYQVMAAASSMRNEGISGLRSLLRADHNNIAAQIGYAEALTWKEETRLDGMKRLQRLAGVGGLSNEQRASVMRAWRTALYWVPTTSRSLPLYDAFLAIFPQDHDVQERRNRAEHAPSEELAQTRTEGFQALDRGNLQQAESDFNGVLKTHPDDADAVGGLGLVRLRQGRSDEATELLNRASQLNPAEAMRWTKALAGSKLAGTYHRIDGLIATGRYNEARQLTVDTLQVAPDQTALKVKLADIDRKQGRTAEAEQGYRSVLASESGNIAALQGLSGLLAADGRLSEAQAFARRIPGMGNHFLRDMRASDLQAEAARADNAGEKITLLTSALNEKPDDPWIRLHLAQALLQSSRQQEAREVMEPILSADSHLTVEQLQAAVFFSSQVNDFDRIRQLLRALPAQARTQSIRQVEMRLEDHDRIATLPPDETDARFYVRRLADSMSDPTGVRGAGVANQLISAGKPSLAIFFLRSLLSSSAQLTAQQRLAYAGSFLSLRRTDETRHLMEGLAGARLTSEEERERHDITTGLAITRSDQLNAKGDQAEAYEVLRPVLADNPSDTSARMALVRLYEARQDTTKADEIVRAVVSRDPDDLEARLALVKLEAQAGRKDEARANADALKERAPTDPRAWIAAARVAEMDGNWRESLEDLARAREFRAAQVRRTDGSLAEDANPFRQQKNGKAESEQDPMLSGIQEDESRVSQTYAPTVDITPGFLGRSGSGLTKLSRADLKMEGAMTVGSGRLGLILDPTVLASGTGSTDYREGLWQTGTTAVTCAPYPVTNSTCYSDAMRRRSAYGVGTNLYYSLGWFKADIGTSPLGFAVTNILGGIELAPQIAPHLTLRTTLERRSITDSVLSYAGMRTTETVNGVTQHRTWGGVTKNRAHAQFEYGDDAFSLYAGGGGAYIYGRNTQSNVNYEAGMGGSFRVYDDGMNKVHLGVDVDWFRYNNNQFLYTPGNGGYFSPQSFFSLTIPVRYAGHKGAWEWGASGFGGFQAYRQRSALLFPRDSSYQTQAAAYYAVAQSCALQQTVAAAEESTTTPCAGVSTSVLSQYKDRVSAKSSSGISGGIDALFYYHITPDLKIGGRFLYQKSGPWNQTDVNLSVHYDFSGVH
ncbi:cellulose synthase subunit BcsC-related outer membrane protein [Gluconobacter japonicus]|uniref:cellulose synthase subunit BcsC-related outer membrane protein n=1 Tax=Gluconobacter japonicus TaxID=376620 RepID=UPI001B8D4F84|nr:cellulose synthase subunit BcsC-related outer membrane protein [Gluconobacter japonicus]MBS1049664.1 BCSC C-terminal domain-containing protein [Gluconobacter japonicus]